ncbi:MAG: hypothetical protein JXO22_17880, partial [Phycisphaerae bacterium]|nr:hypothetical protein [Phycisphaerae bacterium]
TLMGLLAVNVWFASTAATLLVIAVALSWRWLAGDVQLGRAMLDGLVVAIVIIVLARTLATPVALARDMPRTFSFGEPDMWWRLPLVAAATALVGVTLVGVLPRRTGERSRGFAGVASAACAACLFLSIATITTAYLAENARQRWDDATAVALKDEVAAFAGANADRLLDTLRAWNPE